MRKRLILGILLFIGLSHLIDWGPFDLLVNVYAQGTTLTLNVTDSGSQAWGNGTYNVTFVGSPSAHWPGGNIVPFSGSLSSAGSVTINNVPDVNTITPSPSFWQVKVCPNPAISTTQCFLSNFTVTGASLTLNIVPPAISIPVPTVSTAIAPVTAYADAEISGGWVGFQYFQYNATTPSSSVNRVCQVVTGSACTTWAASGSGITSVAVLPATCTPGVTAPVQLSVNPPGFAFCVATNQWANVGPFFGRFFGLSPTDYGAKFNMHQFGDCGETANNTTITCTGSHFTSADTGKSYDFNCPGGAPTVTEGTMTFVSATSITVTQACSVTVTNQGLYYGTDDTVADQAWMTAIIAAAVQGIPNVVRSAYIPQGGSWTTKPLRFVYPGGQDTTTGEGAPGPGAGSGGQLRPALWIMGAGSTSSWFYYPVSFQWQFPSTSADICGVLVNHWDFANISNFGILGAIASNGATAWNTSTNTGIVGGLCFEDNTHSNVQNMYVSGFSNTQNSMPGVAVVSDFESYYAFSAVEVNNINWYWNPLGSAASTGVLTAGIFEKENMDTIYLENPTVLNGTGNLVIGPSSYKQYHMHNIHFRADSGSSRPINVTSSAAVGANDAITCDQCRVTDVEGTGHQGITIQGTGRYDFMDLTYINSNTVSTNAAAVAFTISNAGATLGLVEGEINCASCTNALNATAAAKIYAMDVTLTSPSTHANFATGSATVSAFFRTATGWDGGGVLQSTAHFSNQGGALATITPGAGWGTSATTVPCTTRTGFANKSCFVITSGSASFSAAPTLTVTLPTALPSTAVVCELNVHGITGAGGAIIFDNTTLSTTAPVFTAVTSTGAAFTPAASETYTVVLSCGP